MCSWVEGRRRVCRYLWEECREGTVGVESLEGLELDCVLRIIT